jgi:hypothetical protein
MVFPALVSGNTNAAAMVAAMNLAKMMQAENSTT